MAQPSSLLVLEDCLSLGFSLSETPDLEKRLAELSASTVVLESLCFQLQESKEEAIRTLQQEK